MGIQLSHDPPESSFHELVHIHIFIVELVDVVEDLIHDLEFVFNRTVRVLLPGVEESGQGEGQQDSDGNANQPIGVFECGMGQFHLVSRVMRIGLTDRNKS